MVPLVYSTASYSHGQNQQFRCFAHKAQFTELFDLWHLPFEKLKKKKYPYKQSKQNLTGMGWDIWLFNVALLFPVCKIKDADLK